VVEVEFDLVGRRTNGLVTGELELLKEVLVGVLGHLSALIGIKEDVINVEGGSNKGLLVSLRNLPARSEVGDGPEALADGSEVEVDLDLVVLESDKGEGKSGVAAEPELKRNVESGLRECVTGGAYLGRTTGGGARSVNTGELGLGNVGELSGVSYHLVVSALLLGREGHLVPDVHPVTILAIYALASNLYLNLSDELLSNRV
tara:strand:+ start:597 stop:1205 length:609 start_codon:yes stop_codon:yes gene_type:complete